MPNESPPQSQENGPKPLSNRRRTVIVAGGLAAGAAGLTVAGLLSTGSTQAASPGNMQPQAAAGSETAPPIKLTDPSKLGKFLGDTLLDAAQTNSDNDNTVLSGHVLTRYLEGRGTITANIAGDELNLEAATDQSNSDDIAATYKLSDTQVGHAEQLSRMTATDFRALIDGGAKVERITVTHAGQEDVLASEAGDPYTFMVGRVPTGELSEETPLQPVTEPDQLHQTTTDIGSVLPAIETEV